MNKNESLCGMHALVHKVKIVTELLNWVANENLILNPSCVLSASQGICKGCPYRTTTSVEALYRANVLQKSTLTRKR